MKHYQTPELRARLKVWLDEIAHHLPAQAPLGDFVHHNTLHALQHLPFAEALATASHLTGAHPYWPEAHFRAALQDGRITPAGLSQALIRSLDPTSPAGADGTSSSGSGAGAACCNDRPIPALPELERTEILLAALCSPPPPAPAAGAWQLAEAEVDDPSLLALCRNLLATPYPADGDDRTTEAAWQHQAQDAWRALRAQSPAGHWRPLLLALTGRDLLAKAASGLRRHLAAHLDLGIAAWHHPARPAGFYAAWRQSEAGDLAWDLDDLPGARDQIADLPADPLTTLIASLAELCPESADWPALLQALAQEWPGWAGMMARREHHPVPESPPVSLLDFLAVRVTLERLLGDALAAELAGPHHTLADLDAHFARRPGELALRLALRRGTLDEAIRHHAHALLLHAPCDEAACAALAAQLADPSQQKAGGEAADRAAWQLYPLLRQLRLSADQLARLDGHSARRLLAISASLDPLQRGQIWLDAYECHYRDSLLQALSSQPVPLAAPPAAPSAQLVLCMDDREEGTRRHLEEIAPEVATFGAAGFFGVAMYWQGLDDAAPTALCPVVVTPDHLVRELPLAGETGAATHRAGQLARRRQWRRAFVQGSRRPWLGAVLASAVGAVPALGALTLRSLAPAAFGRWLSAWRARRENPVATRLQLTRQMMESLPEEKAAPTAPPDTLDPSATSGTSTAPLSSATSATSATSDATAHLPPASPPSHDAPRQPADGFSTAEQIQRVAGFLRTIGLKAPFARLVVMLGHGSDSRNNPHFTAYDCGACSGRHGGPNARVFARMANRPEVRAGLAGLGIDIPEDCRFIAGEHNTCDDSLAWYDLDRLPASHEADFERLAGQLGAACRAHAAERCRRLASAPADASPHEGEWHVRNRREDISQARPELGHATNAAAFIGRREMSRGLFLDRRVFLISYDPLGDDDGAIIESILLAAGPVGAGISLEYYFSTVDNERYGCGSKVTHNLTGLFGVMDGADSDLRTGLPWQMVEIHEAMRLLVVVEQTPEMLTAIVGRQPALQELVGNGWIVLAAKNPSTASIDLYCPRRGWLSWTGAGVLPQVGHSADWFAGESGALTPAIVLRGAP